MDIGRVEDSARMARESGANAVLAGYDATTSLIEQMMTAYWDYANHTARMMMGLIVNTEQYTDAMRQAGFDSGARQASSSDQHQGQGQQSAQRPQRERTSTSAGSASSRAE